MALWSRLRCEMKVIAAPAGRAPVWVLVALWASCLYDTHIPLRNHRPQVIDVEAVETRLVYPDSTICTLRVLDRNDASLAYEFVADSDSVDPVPRRLTPTAEVIHGGLGEKAVCLCLGGTMMGTVQCALRISDPHDSSTTLPCRIEKVFVDSFNKPSLDTLKWRTHSSRDTEYVATNFSDWKLQFLFDTTGAADTGDCKAGIRSRFRVIGPFTATIDYKLRDDMVEGFRTAFVASTSRDTGKYDGRQFGIYLEGMGNWVNIRCRSGWSTYSSGVDHFAGTLQLRRRGEMISFGCREPNPRTGMRELSTFEFTGNDTLFFHISMEVTDNSRVRHCDWNDFVLKEGEVIP